MGQIDDDIGRYGYPEDSEDHDSEAECKFCKQDGLTWESYWTRQGEKWRLVDGNGDPHVCDPSDDFEDLDA